jgi:hypothetical protein
MPHGIGVNLVESAGEVQPAVAGSPGGVGGAEQVGAEPGRAAAGGAVGKGAEQDLAVVADDRAGGGDMAQ